MFNERAFRNKVWGALLKSERYQMFCSRELAKVLTLAHNLFPAQKLLINVYTDDEDEHWIEVCKPGGATVVKVHESGTIWMQINGILEKVPQAVEEVQNAISEGRFGAIIEEG